MTNLKEMVDRVAERTGIARHDCLAVSMALIAQIREEIAAGDEVVVIPQLGVFRRQAREGDENRFQFRPKKLR